MFNLSATVRERFTESIARLSSANLQKHHKVLAFKDSMKNTLNQGNACAEEIRMCKLFRMYVPVQYPQDFSLAQEGGCSGVRQPPCSCDVLSLLHPEFKGGRAHRHQGKYLLHQGTLHSDKSCIVGDNIFWGTNLLHVVISDTQCVMLDCIMEPDYPPYTAIIH